MKRGMLHVDANQQNDKMGVKTNTSHTHKI
jgi:hypothetical protein